MRMAVLVIAACAAGCDNPPTTDDGMPSTGQPVAIDYAAMAKRYNARVDRVDRLWARSVIEVDFVNANGKNRFEQGDGNLMLRKPGEVAMTVGKLGETMLWVGADIERFWWIDLKPADGEQITAYVGRNDQINPGDTTPGSGPLPVTPDQLIALMGLTPIATDEQSHAEAEVAAPGDGSRVWVTTPLGETKDIRPARRTLIEVATGQAIEVEITDAAGEVVVSSKLDRYQAMELDQSPPGAWPMVATRVEITTPTRKGRLTLFLSEVSDGKRRGRIKDAQFDFEELVKAWGVERVKVLRMAKP